MSPRDSLLPEAMSRLTLFDVAKAAGIEIHVGVQHSPFRIDDKKSFSVQKNRTGWRDFATDEGGSIWEFAKRAFPNQDKGQLARTLIGLAGLDGDSPVAPARSALVPLRPRTVQRAFKHAQPWSELVERRWTLGVGGVDVASVQRLAQRRGWPESFVHGLIGLGLLSYPVLPWHEELAGGARRGWAFRVDRLRLGEDGGLTTEPVGYHQTHEVFDREANKARKSFVYVPYEPAADKQRSTFQRFLRGTVPPYPFFLGGRKPRLLVFHEGQWDAGTFFFAALSDRLQELDEASAAALPWAVVGLRGAQSVDATLEVLGPYLRAHRPDIWLWPDNDRAGSTWLETAKGKAPCLLEQLLASGARKVVISRVRPHALRDGKACKDFNDLYRHSPVSAGAVREHARASGFGEHFARAAAGVGS